MYSFALYIFAIGAYIASLFNKKIRTLIKGHYDTYRILKEKIGADDKVVWFHAASLGEFEQGRPMMERLRKEHPEYKILLTFFSPSGYEVRKNYEGADVICYLPFDTPDNARMFVKYSHPTMAIFIKYEFWENYFRRLHKRGIPIYSVSSIFRPQQHFFKWYGRGGKTLKYVTHFYVQNEESKHLLNGIGIDCVTIVGDTRMDRVIEIRRQAKELPLAETFSAGSDNVLVAGSSWPPDEDIIIPYFNSHPKMKLILAPHKIDEAHLKDIESKITRRCVRYTKLTSSGESSSGYDCMIIDCFGLLSSIYRYGTVAYVGGGFGVGIHNVPEAAVYGLPVIIGPNNKKFREAQQLLKIGGCIEIHDSAEFTAIYDKLTSDNDYLDSVGKKAGDYISSHSGATDKVFKSIFG